MGTSSDAHCFACGYDTFLLLGGGMANSDRFAAWPVHCETCVAITTANYKEPVLVCEACKGKQVIPVSDRGEWKGDGTPVVNWGDLALTNGHHRCPKCGVFELRFATNAGGHGGILWD